MAVCRESETYFNLETYKSALLSTYHEKGMKSTDRNCPRAPLTTLFVVDIAGPRAFKNHEFGVLYVPALEMESSGVTASVLSRRK